MIANLAFLACGDTENAIGDLGDEELLAAAHKHLEDLQERVEIVDYH